MMNIRGRHIGLILLVAVLVLVGCTNTAYEESNRIVEVTEVASLVGQDGVIVVDARTPEEYAKGHLEGAVNIPISEVSKDKPVKNMLADKATVEKALGAKGITADTRVLIYDDKGGIFAGRVHWAMTVYGHENVQLINGGAAAIVAEGLSLTKEVPDYPKADYVAQDANTAMIATFDMVNEQVENPQDNVKILDVRSLAEVAEGSIPGSICYPHTENYYSDGTFKSVRATELDYKDLGFKKDDTIYIYCKSSLRATVPAILLEEAGYTDVKIYDGAWLEWETQGTIEEVEAPVVTTQDAS